MILWLAADAKQLDVEMLCRELEGRGGRVLPVVRQGRRLLVVTDVTPPVREAAERVPWVERVESPPTSFPLASRHLHPDNTEVGPSPGCRIGGIHLHVVAGPCAIEDRPQALAVAEQVRAAGLGYYRGGLFKPRTSPYDFQGLGLPGLPILREIRSAFGLQVVTEAMDETCLDQLADVADIIQVGSRNMQNYSLLKRLGSIGKPVLLKRGMAATLTELLSAAEYILLGGNERVILCERGIRALTDHSRNVLDLGAVPFLKQETHLPVLVDPSHGTGRASLVRPMARAAIAAGADGVMVEVHPDPRRALSDSMQSIDFPEFGRLVADLRAMAAAVGRSCAAHSGEIL